MSELWFSMVEPKFISFFAGCGGSSLGYKMAGYKELLAIEWEDNAIETLKLNFPELKILKADINKITGEQILNEINMKKGELDLLDASPPCQGFSMAGKRKIFDGRNSLYIKTLELIEEIEPKVFVIENVKGMIMGGHKVFTKKIFDKLNTMNYNWKAKLMNSKYYNVPQSRERIIIIGVRKDLNKEPTFPKPNNKIITMREVLKDCPDYEDREMADWLKKAYPYLNGKNTAEIFKKFKGTTGGSFSTILLKMNKPSQTLTKSEISITGLLHPTKPRYLNEHELKRICSFPEDFKFTNRKKAVERLGNAVMPNFMKEIALTIKNNIFTNINQ